jgi:DNA-binding GntR family transcriptional regulator
MQEAAAPKALADDGPLPRSNGRSNVYRDLREAIIGGQFQPAERLIEIDLARMFGAGRTSVQGALTRLEQEGLVERQPNRGARVRLVTDSEALEIQQVRAALEQLLAREAASRLTETDLADLRAILAEMEDRVAASDPLGYTQLDTRFHQRIWAISGHTIAATMLTNLKSQGIRHQYRTFLQPGRPGQSLQEHIRVVEALASRDPEASEAAMRDHLKHVIDTLKLAIVRHRFA